MPVAASIRQVALCTAAVCALFLPAAIAGGEVSPNDLKLASDFDGALGSPLDGRRYWCQGASRYLSLPAPGNPGNRAFEITLDPKIPVDPNPLAICHSLRAELAEAKDVRIPLGTDVWYSLRFYLPSDMMGKIAGRRFVMAQMKQDSAKCRLSGGESPFAIDDYNPTISLRLVEDVQNHLIGTELDVSSKYVRKIVTGTVMRRSEEFFGNWHEFILHTKLVPREEGNLDTSLDGFVEGSLDGQPFRTPAYGRKLVEGTSMEAVEVMEPFGYPKVDGCTYFKFGIYGDPDESPWTIAVDRFRRGATKADVK